MIPAPRRDPLSLEPPALLLHSFCFLQGCSAGHASACSFAPATSEGAPSPFGFAPATPEKEVGWSLSLLAFWRPIPEGAVPRRGHCALRGALLDRERPILRKTYNPGKWNCTMVKYVNAMCEITTGVRRPSCAARKLQTKPQPTAAVIMSGFGPATGSRSSQSVGRASCR